MTLIEDLQAACYEIARNSMRGRRPIDVDEIQRVAERFYELAAEQVQYVEDRGYPGTLVLHAVRYLADAHAIPPTRDSIFWFGDMLSVLVELACPRSPSSPRNAPFYAALMRSLAETLASLASAGAVESPESGSRQQLSRPSGP